MHKSTNLYIPHWSAFSVEFGFTWYYNSGWLLHADSKDTGQSSHVLISTIVALCMITNSQYTNVTHRQMDGRVRHASMFKHGTKIVREHQDHNWYSNLEDKTNNTKTSDPKIKTMILSWDVWDQNRSQTLYSITLFLTFSIHQSKMIHVLDIFLFILYKNSTNIHHPWH